MGKLIVDKFLGVENFLRKKSSKNVFYAILATFLLHPFPLNDHSFSSLGFQDWQLFIFEVHGEEGRGGGHQILVWLGIYKTQIPFFHMQIFLHFLVFDHYVASFLKHFCYFYYIFEF